MKKTIKETKGSISNSQLYEKAFLHTQGYSYLLDKNGILINCNHRFRQLLTLDTLPEKKPGLLYKLMSEQGLWSDVQAAMLKETDINVLLNGVEQLNTPELPVLDGKGGVIYYQGSRIPLCDKKGNVIGLLVILNDITEQNNREKQIKKITSQLQQNNADEESHTENPSRKMRSDSPRILVVEDNTLAQKAAQAILMNNDCLVDVADNEKDFNRLFVPGKYDLVFMDIGLENTSGYVMAKQIRQQETDTGFHVPVIALTGFEADVVRDDCSYYQMEGVITKPLTAEQVKQIIQHYIFHINLEITGFKSVAYGKV